MKDCQSLLELFANGWASFFTGKEYSGIPDGVIKYLNNYWLDKAELDNIWIPIKNTIFKGDYLTYPENIFKEDFTEILLKGGSLFDREYFDELHACITQTGDKYFVVVEDCNENNILGNPQPPTMFTSADTPSWPPLRFKFPIDITFDEMLSGEYLSEELVLMFHRYYFVFGDSERWGIYTPNDAVGPLRIIGVKNQFSVLFNSQLSPPEKDKEDIKKWIQEDIDEINSLRKSHPQH